MVPDGFIPVKGRHGERMRWVKKGTEGNPQKK
jgi:hypothetical protein